MLNYSAVLISPVVVDSQGTSQAAPHLIAELCASSGSQALVRHSLAARPNHGKSRRKILQQPLTTTGSGHRLPLSARQPHSNDSASSIEYTTLSMSTQNTPAQQCLNSAADPATGTSSLQELLKALVDAGQVHLCAFWPAAGRDDASKRRLIQQLTQLDRGYPGGLVSYLRNARFLLEASRAGKNPYARCIATVPTGVLLSAQSDSGALQQHERLGLAAAARCGFVLVAGGLGERLGYHGIKVRLRLCARGCMRRKRMGRRARDGMRRKRMGRPACGCMRRQRMGRRAWRRRFCACGGERLGYHGIEAGLCLSTVVPVMFGKPLLNNVLKFDHVQLQK